MKSLVWFRNDLRVHDHPALSAACQRGLVEAVYCACVTTWRAHHMSDWRLAFQLRALQALAQELAQLGIQLTLLEVDQFSEVPDALAKYCVNNKVQAVDYIEEYPIDERRRDHAVDQVLNAQGIQTQRHIADVVVAPGLVKTAAGKPFSVFTPFYRQWLTVADQRPVQMVPNPVSEGVAVAELPRSWAEVSDQFGAELWPAGEAAAHATLGHFINEGLAEYPQRRDQPGVSGTSSLSAHLAVGAISARQSVAAVTTAAEFDPDLAEGARAWVREIAWRDFYRHIVAAFDRISFGSAFRIDTNALPWRQAPAELAAWQAGKTGYPFVDAAMRQLTTTGWMHNRLRMVCAMFLTKHLLIDWREGERFFMQHLVDGDFASNNGGWQWSASTGTDAAPYFRIFNPATQGERFDPDGQYTHRYLPELRDLSGKGLFQPPADLRGDYPAPIVDHKEARQRALAFFKANR